MNALYNSWKNEGAGQVEHGSCSEVLRAREHFMSYAGAWKITSTVQSKGI